MATVRTPDNSEVSVTDPAVGSIGDPETQVSTKASVSNWKSGLGPGELLGLQQRQRDAVYVCKAPAGN